MFFLNTINLSHNFMKSLFLSVYDIRISKQVAEFRTDTPPQ